MAVKMLFNPLNIQVRALKTDANGVGSPASSAKLRRVSMSGKFYSRGKMILRRSASMALAMAIGTVANAGVVRDGGEYRLADELPGDQNKADLALGPSG